MNIYVEEWKDVPTWEGIYQCSNYGRIKRFLKLKNGTIKQQIHLGTKTEDGYLFFTLKYYKRKERWFVHRLVATVFQRPLKFKEVAHHKNNFPWCNCNFNIQIKSNFKHLSDHHSGMKMPPEAVEKSKPTQFKKGQKFSQQIVAKREETKRQKRLLDPNYGKYEWSQQQRQNMRKVQTGRKHTEQWKRNVSQKLKGHPVSQQTKNKISQTKKMHK